MSSSDLNCSPRGMCGEHSKWERIFQFTPYKYFLDDSAICDSALSCSRISLCVYCPISVVFLLKFVSNIIVVINIFINRIILVILHLQIFWSIFICFVTNVEIVFGELPKPFFTIYI